MNKKVVKTEGNSKTEIGRCTGKKVVAFKSWGKHFLICFNGFTVRIHFMLFGTYRINERKETTPRLALVFANGELNFYACSIKFIDEPLDEMYDWSADVMSDQWDAKAAKQKLLSKPGMLVCDVLLAQDIFSGSGNIIKNEVLFRIKVHPGSQVGCLPEEKLDELIAECRNYSFDFLDWKKKYELKKHWLAHTKTICPRCNIPLHKEYMGKTNRRTFFCSNCQELYV